MIKMKNYLLNKIRKATKSIGKIENNIQDKITYNLSKKQKSLTLKEKDFENIIRKKNVPKKIATVICFYFKEKRLSTLNKNILKISKYNFKKNITIITNDISRKEEDKIKKIIKSKIKEYSIIKVKNLPDDNFLPWHSINIMKEKIKNKSYSHFMFLEDDIIVSSENISYWLYFRKKLKKYNLIPNFLRCEKFNGKYYSVDNPKVILKDKVPTIFSQSKNSGFINSKYPYSGMYLMDRDLLKNFLNSKASKIDFSFTNKVMKSLYPIKELANISYAYHAVPPGYHNRLVLPFFKNKILQSCIILHSELKYVRHKNLNKTGYGTIEINSLIK